MWTWPNKDYNPILQKPRSYSFYSFSISWLTKLCFTWLQLRLTDSQFIQVSWPGYIPNGLFLWQASRSRWKWFLSGSLIFYTSRLLQYLPSLWITSRWSHSRRYDSFDFQAFLTTFLKFLIFKFEKGNFPRWSDCGSPPFWIHDSGFSGISYAVPTVTMVLFPFLYPFNSYYEGSGIPRFNCFVGGIVWRLATVALWLRHAL